MNYISLSTNELKKFIDEEKDMIIVNVLPDTYFNEERIPGSVNIDGYKMDFVTDAEKLLTDKNKVIVIYASGADSEASTHASERLSKNGWQHIYNYKEGIDGWKKAGFLLEGTGESSITVPSSKTFSLDLEQSVVRWTGRNMNSIHYGTLMFKEGKAEIADGQFKNGVFVIDMNSLKNEDLENDVYRNMLETHLKSEDFFHSVTYPTAQITFKHAKQYAPFESGKPNTEIVADLSIKDITKEITFPASIYLEADGTLKAHASLSIDRTLWNVTYGSSTFFKKLGMHLVDDMITLDIKIVAK